MRASPFIWSNDLQALIRSVQSSHNHQYSLEAAFELWKAYKSRKSNLFVSPCDFEEFKVDAKSTMDFCLQMFYHPGSLQRAIIKTIECGGDTDTNASIVGEYFNYQMGGITKQDAEYVESKLDKRQLNILLKFNK
jgi:ADP-ribosylglycohydrolase